jgi:hypothetical protein
MESGADVWPFDDFAKYRGDVIVRASKAGIAIVIPMGPRTPESVQIGRKVSIREFCEKIRAKFPIMDKIEKQPQGPRQEQIPGIAEGRIL